MTPKFELGALFEGKLEKITLKEISLEETTGKDRIGTAYGIDVGHCCCIGARHGVEVFRDRVKWYHVRKEPDEHSDKLRETQPGSICVEFYAEKLN